MAHADVMRLTRLILLFLIASMEHYLNTLKMPAIFWLIPQKDQLALSVMLCQAIYGNKDRDYNVNVLVKRMHRIDKNVSAEGREQFLLP